MRKEMEMLVDILKHPQDIYPLMKLIMKVNLVATEIPTQPHWAFCYTLFRKFSRPASIAVQQIDDAELRNITHVFYLVLRALDTIEDDTSIPTEVKVNVLNDFYRHIHDREWHFSCGTNHSKLLMDEFHHVSAALLELDERYQKIINYATRDMGVGMAKFISKEIETIDDYDEYCCYSSGTIGVAMGKICNVSRSENIPPKNLTMAMSLLVQKVDIIKDYFEDINEIPKPRILWPRQIWSKYANKLEDLKFEENSIKAVQCLNEMITNALMHVEDCLKYQSSFRDPLVIQGIAIIQIWTMRCLALCYNNVEVFRGSVKLRPGLTARIILKSRSASDVYDEFYNACCLMKSKIDKDDPNATKTLTLLNSIQNTCRESGLINKRESYVPHNKLTYKSIMIVLIFIILSIVFASLSRN